MNGIREITEARARWLGHKLHVDVAIAVDDGLLLAEARAIAEDLERELFKHIPALSVAQVRFSDANASHHSHEPAAVRVETPLARGLLEIAETGAGERMRLRVSRHAKGLKAEVEIDRGPGQIERLALAPLNGDHHLLQSAKPPGEPHSFRAILKLSSGKQRAQQRFSMEEPDHHH